jgi:sialate O-acetylesterase
MQFDALTHNANGGARSPHRAMHTRAILRIVFTLIAALATAAPSLLADPALPHLFSDHMVLQRDRAISIWGWSDPGEKIAITLNFNAREATASAKGYWSVNLPATRAGGPFTLIVKGARKSIMITDVMIGEVWVASGQSNMTFALEGSEGGASEVANADEPEIRLFTVPRRVALDPQADTLAASWQVCTPESAKDFSAVGYYFAKKLYEKLRVPIGIIHSGWPGTSAQLWTDPASLRGDPILQPIVAKWDATPAATKEFARRGAEIDLEFDDFELLPKQPGAAPQPFSNFDDETARTWPDGSWFYHWTEAGATAFELKSPGRESSGYDARVHGTYDGATHSALRATFHRDAAPIDLTSYSGIRFWARGNGTFVFKTRQPTIWDEDNYRSVGFQATPDWRPIEIHFADMKQENWGIPEDFTLNAITKFEIVSLPAGGEPPLPPSGLYKAMIEPLVHFGIRGTIWYQGESNALTAFQYRSLLPAMIRGWRDAWDEGDFPFLIVQLPNFGSSPELGDSAWAELREAQFLTAKSMTNTGLAVTIDIGDPKNLHPREKRGVGERLALWALGTTYGEKIVYSGPLYQSMKSDGDAIRVHFANTGSGLESKGGDALKGFAIAGSDGKFHWAQARIEGDTVVVSSPDVPVPVAVRYAWANSPDCNLYNKEELPASPFRTDDWPGVTTDNR